MGLKKIFFFDKICLKTLRGGPSIKKFINTYSGKVIEIYKIGESLLKQTFRFRRALSSNILSSKSY